ncbi:N-acetyltransferase [Streptomyces sp. NPDC039016]|uniref:GNAT family N-acetyltransferase n=1 Tax=Streptomyces sp. NPDC039016 TaxID=3154330 RepID=UPI00340C9F74
MHDGITAPHRSTGSPPFSDGGSDVLRAADPACAIDLDIAPRNRRRLPAPGGVPVATENEGGGSEPSPQAQAQAQAQAHRAGCYELRPRPAPAAAPTTAPPSTLLNGTAMHTTWTTRPEISGTPGTTETSEDIAAVRAINLAAFPTAYEADLVDALRADPDAWIDGLSLVSQAPDGTLAGYALLTRCHIDDRPALALAPCAVVPAYQRQGAGTAAIRAALDAARAQGESLVVVLGHADYYPRFGFVPASRFGIRAPFDAPDEALMALTLDASRPVPGGVIRYAAAFGV